MNLEQMNSLRKEMTFSFNRFSKMLGVDVEEVKLWKSWSAIPQRYITLLTQLND